MNTSPSSLARELACPASALLPQVDSISEPALRGTALHAFLCAVGMGLGRDLAASKLPERWRETAMRIELPAGLDPRAGVPELCVAWNVETGETRELGRGGTLTREQLRALARDGEMVLTADWVALDESSIHVRDWKTGWTSVDKAEVNAQLAAYAVALAKHFKRDRAHVDITRLLDDGSSFVDKATLDALDLDDAEVKIRNHVRAMAERERLFRSSGVLPKLVEGAHCKFCNAFKSCPAKGSLIRSALHDEGETPAFLTGIPLPLSATDAALLWPKLQMVEDLVKRLKGSIKELAAREPLTLPNGKVLGEVEKSTRSVDAKVVERLVEPSMYAEVAETETTVTLSRLEAALKKRLQPGQKLAPELRALLAEVEKAGGLKTSTWVSVEEVSPNHKKLRSAEGNPALPSAAPDPLPGVADVSSEAA